MTKAGTTVFAALLALVAPAGAAEEKDKAAKPVVPCDRIVEAYKTNNSVDGTADTFLIDQSRVVECLKAAGIATPLEDDR
jgi:hypothetical protein